MVSLFYLVFVSLRPRNSSLRFRDTKTNSFRSRYRFFCYWNISGRQSVCQHQETMARGPRDIPSVRTFSQGNITFCRNRQRTASDVVWNDVVMGELLLSSNVERTQQEIICWVGTTKRKTQQCDEPATADSLGHIELQKVTIIHTINH